MSGELAAFLRADVLEWSGLPAGTLVRDLEELTGGPGLTLDGRAGEPATRRERVSLATKVFSQGLFAWLDPGVPALGTVIALEGRFPFDPDGIPMPAPDFGPPDAAYPTVLGSLELPDGELLYADQGLAVRMNPENGYLLGLIGFTPTDVETYEAEIRPLQSPLRHLMFGEGA